jgi:hypothetical protein
MLVVIVVSVIISLVIMIMCVVMLGVIKPSVIILIVLALHEDVT